MNIPYANTLWATGSISSLAVLDENIKTNLLQTDYDNNIVATNPSAGHQQNFGAKTSTRMNKG